MITPEAAKLTELDIYRITGHLPYKSDSYSGSYSTNYDIFNNRMDAKKAHDELGKPYPEELDADAIIDFTEFMPKLYTAAEIAEKYNIPLDDCKLRIEAAHQDPEGCEYAYEYADGQTDDGELLWWADYSIERWVVGDELITESGLADKYGIDRRTVKKALASYFETSGGTINKQFGKRVYTYYWLSHCDSALKRAGHI